MAENFPWDSNSTISSDPDTNAMRVLNHKEHGYSKIYYSDDPYDDYDKSKPSTTCTVERFEVRSGDGEDYDAENDRERSEIEQKNEVEEKETYEYEWKMFLPNDFPNIFPTKLCLGQFYERKNADCDHNGPAWMFQNRAGGLWLDRQNKKGTLELVKLIDESELRNKWHSFKVKVMWTKNASGIFECYVNGVNKYNRQNIPTFNGGNINFRYGIYRSFLNRYKWMDEAISGNNQCHCTSLPTQIAYYRDFNFRKL